MKNVKVGIIGAGDIGFNLAEILSLQGAAVTLYNRYHASNNEPSEYWLQKQGKVMDMNDSLELPGCSRTRLISDLSGLDGMYATVITAGSKRTSIYETREELAGKNAKIIREFAHYVNNNRSTLILIISNPVDFLTQFLINEVAKISDQSADEIAKRVVGVSYIDSMRLKSLVREFMRNNHKAINSPVIEGIALGEHGPSMVPLISSVKVNGAEFSKYANKEQMDSIYAQTVARGNDIIKLTGASSVLGPAHAVMHMIREISNTTQVDIPCSIYDGKRAIGKMVRFVESKVDSIVDVAMNEEEARAMKKCENVLDSQYTRILDLIANS